MEQEKEPQFDPKAEAIKIVMQLSAFSVEEQIKILAAVKQMLIIKQKYALSKQQEKIKNCQTDLEKAKQDLEAVEAMRTFEQCE